LYQTKKPINGVNI